MPIMLATYNTNKSSPKEELRIVEYNTQQLDKKWVVSTAGYDECRRTPSVRMRGAYDRRSQDFRCRGALYSVSKRK